MLNVAGLDVFIYSIILEPIFYSSFIAIIHAYFLYPFSIYLLGIIKRNEVIVGDEKLSITIIITAFNRVRKSLSISPEKLSQTDLLAAKKDPLSPTGELTLDSSLRSHIS